MGAILKTTLAFLIAASTLQTAASAPWEMPEGVKTLTVNSYPMAFLDKGTGQTVVLVHGAGAHDYRVWEQLTAAPLSSFRLVAVSLRHLYPEPWDGKGDDYSIKQHAEDLTAFIDALGVGPVYLVAHSRGGSVGLIAAKARPDLIKKLVLMEGAFFGLLPKPAPASAKPGIPIGETRKAVAVRFTQGDIDGGLELWWDRDRPGSWARLSDAWRQMSRDNAWTLLAPPEVSPVTCDDVAGLKAPVLLMQGEKTNPQMKNVVDATYKCLPSAARVIIPNAGHPMHLDNPAAFRSELVKFLSK